MVELGKLGLDCLILSEGAVDLGRACHCIAATLATLAANEGCARLVMDAPGGSVVRSVLALVEVRRCLSRPWLCLRVWRARPASPAERVTSPSPACAKHSLR